MPTDRIRGLNTQIQAIASEEGARYLNVFDTMVGEGNSLKKEYTTDGIHLTASGYRAWTNLL